MTLSEIRERAIAPALALLPARMSSREAEIMLLAITQQEDPEQRRRQWPTGPARGLLQFEQTIGEIGGFPIVYNGVEIRGGNFAADATVTIPGDPDPLITFPVDPDASVAGIATRAANQVNGLDRELTKRQGYIAESKDAIEKIDRRLGAAFPEQSELQEKRDALADLEAELEAESKAASAEAAAATVEAESADIEQPINGDRFSVSSADRVRGFGSKEKLREFLADGPFGKFLAKRIDEGKIVLHDDASTIPGANGMKSVGGVTNIDGKIHLNAATLGRNRALGVALHELFHAGTMPLVGTKAWDGLIARLGSLRKQAATGSPKLRALHDAANRRIETANTDQVAAGLKPLSTAVCVAVTGHMGAEALRLIQSGVISRLKAGWQAASNPPKVESEVDR